MGQCADEMRTWLYTYNKIDVSSKTRHTNYGCDFRSLYVLREKSTAKRSEQILSLTRI